TDDPFQNAPVNLPHQVLGSPRPFSEYLSGVSTVQARTIDDVKNFLVTQCLYKSDIRRFGCLDHWQTPEEFEKSREGDCEDSALWAWRKLHEMGIQAHFVVGLCVHDDKKYISGHAWVMFFVDGKWRIFESMAKSLDKMVLSLGKARGIYYPMYSVDRDTKTFFYSGVRLATQRAHIDKMQIKAWG
ncbi:MAG: transglutaminase-like cysteine peptidase, partial [Candidatus Omnitrophica bacterium]|nr:transglutaminase-like cysteine peptidase [Candidatus Omnitrophota bacterium]